MTEGFWEAHVEKMGPGHQADEIFTCFKCRDDVLMFEERRRIVQLLISEELLHPDDETDQGIMELIFEGQS